MRQLLVTVNPATGDLLGLARGALGDETMAVWQRMKKNGGKVEADTGADAAMEGVRLRSELQRAIEEERYRPMLFKSCSGVPAGLC